MKNIVVNGVDLGEYDIFDADQAEKYEKVLDEASKPITAEGLKTSAVIRKECEKVFDVFNTLFGEGTDKKVFSDRVNIKVCLEAFASLVEQMNSQKEEVEKLTSKYSPNRAQRRTKK